MRRGVDRTYVTATCGICNRENALKEMEIQIIEHERFLPGHSRQRIPQTEIYTTERYICQDCAREHGLRVEV